MVVMPIPQIAIGDFDTAEIKEVQDALNACSEISNLHGPVNYQLPLSSSAKTLKWSFQFLLKERVDACICIDESFPLSSPIIFINKKYFCKWPHVEKFGKLCLFKPSTIFKQSDLKDIITYYIKKSFKLLNESIQGSNINDFKDEIQSYWEICAYSNYSKPVISILKPPFSTRVVTCWFGNHFILLAEKESQANKWLSNYSNLKNPQKLNFFNSILVNIGDNVIKPCNYPKTGNGLLRIFNDFKIVIDNEIKEIFATNPPLMIVNIAINTVYGDCIISSIQKSPEKSDLTKGGFRSIKNQPFELLKNRMFTSKSQNSNVTRADTSWVHGRDQNPKISILSEKVVTVIGCGSIGSAVSELLLKSGIGTINIIDGELLTTSNVSRHVLGMNSINKFKSLELGSKFRKAYPHCTVEAWYKNWQDIGNIYHTLESSDLILELTADKFSLQKLNRWHLNDNGRKTPVIYGYTENKATAGFCLTIGEDGGCIECAQDEFGEYKLKIINWPKDSLHQEPGCGAEFVSYGAVQLQSTTSLISKKALNILLKTPRESELECWIDNKQTVASLGGKWTEEWKKHNCFKDEGYLIFSQLIEKACPLCA